MKTVTTELISKNRLYRPKPCPLKPVCRMQIKLASFVCQIRPDAKQFRYQKPEKKCKVVGLKNKGKGYIDYNATATASLMAQMKGEAFDLNAYLAGNDAKKLNETVSSVKIVDKTGKVL